MDRNIEKARNIQRARTERNAARIYVRECDVAIFACVVVLLLFGLVMVLSASYYSAMNAPKIGDMYFYFKRQLMSAVAGVAVMALMAFGVKYDGKFMKLAVYPGWLLSVALLVLVAFVGRGDEGHGANRWLTIPVFGSFQPSEFAKVMVILALARFIADDKTRTKRLLGLGGCAVIVGVPAGAAYFFTNNFSSAAIMVLVGFCMIFITTPYYKRLVVIGGALAGGALAYFAFFTDGFRSDRIKYWLDPWLDPSDKGYQPIQSLYAVASGGFFGLGLGQSNQKMQFMPEPQNDFIFAIICEELGIFGAALVLVFFGIIIWRGIKVAVDVDDLLGTLTAAGIVALVGVQVIINVAVVTNTIPNTGIPLPFISYGGTALLGFMGLMGVLLNISRYTKGR